MTNHLYRTQVDPLMDVSKLPLSYTASQLNSVSLDLIVSGWKTKWTYSEQTLKNTILYMIIIGHFALCTQKKNQDTMHSIWICSYMLSNIKSIPYMPLHHNYETKMHTRLSEENIPRFIHQQEQINHYWTRTWHLKSVKASSEHL